MRPHHGADRSSYFGETPGQADRLVSPFRRRYNPAMRERVVLLLVLLCSLPALGQTVPADWKIVKDPRNICQIKVPPEWVPLGENTGAAVFHDSTTAIAVVTSQPKQTFKPLSASLQKLLGVAKEKMFENTAKRIFYQEKISRGAEDPDAYSASVPGKDGTCSCHGVFLPSISGETARKIMLSLGSVPD
jgi:hypothetical protein